MTENKINLVMALPGRTMMSEQQCSRKVRKQLISKKTGKPVIGKDGNPVYKTIKEADPTKSYREFIEFGEGDHRETMVVYTRKCIPASRHITLSMDSYRYFISKQCPYDFHAPANFKPAKPYSTRNERAWEAMTQEERLEWHLNQLCRALGGILTQYTVLDE